MWSSVPCKYYTRREPCFRGHQCPYLHSDEARTLYQDVGNGLWEDDDVQHLSSSSSAAHRHGGGSAAAAFNNERNAPSSAWHQNSSATPSTNGRSAVGVRGSMTVRRGGGGGGGAWGEGARGNNNTSARRHQDAEVDENNSGSSSSLYSRRSSWTPPPPAIPSGDYPAGSAADSEGLFRHTLPHHSDDRTMAVSAFLHQFAAHTSSAARAAARFVHRGSTTRAEGPNAFEPPLQFPPPPPPAVAQRVRPSSSGWNSRGSHQHMMHLGRPPVERREEGSSSGRHHEVDVDNMSYDELVHLCDSVGAVDVPTRNWSRWVLSEEEYTRQHHYCHRRRRRQRDDDDDGEQEADRNKDCDDDGTTCSICMEDCFEEPCSADAGVSISGAVSQRSRETTPFPRSSRASVEILPSSRKFHVVRLPCNHYLHFECAEPHLSKRHFCPVCRLDLNDPSATTAAQMCSRR